LIPRYAAEMTKYDVLIVGAGLNGLVAALALGGAHCQRPLRVGVIDRVHPSSFAGSTHDSRASALTAATQLMLQALGVWDELKTHAQNMTQTIVSDGKTPEKRPSLLNFIAESEAEAPAALVENALIFKALLDQVALSPEIEIIAPMQIPEFKFGPGLALVKLNDGQELRASLIVGADGRGSATRKAAGIAFEGWEYPQSAITLTVGHEMAHHGRAEEHFTPTGVFAILPLKGNRSSIVWTEPHQVAKDICAKPDAEFLAELSTKFGDHLGPLTLLSPRHAYPLSMAMAQSFVGPRLALLGDAAHVVHPLAGLGLNLGFKDAAALAECVGTAFALGQDVGGVDVLENYMRWRRFDTLATAGLLDGLNRLFANDNEALRQIRQAGLKLVDRVPLLKKSFMQEAAGQLGQLPKLMRGLGV
jgi:2-octaprenyl-6-methoxyphenol hydroxylase